VILWFTVAQVAVALACALWATGRGITRRTPDDFSVLSLALVELLLLAQVVVAIIAPAVGNHPTGDPLEYWMYLITALLIPIIAGVLAVVERSRWASIIVGIAAFGIAVMLWRMQVIWGA